MKYSTVLSTIILTIFVLTGCSDSSSDTNTSNNNQIVKPNEHTTQQNKVSGNDSKQIIKEEVILFSFRTAKDNKVLSISTSKENDYIVYRYGIKDKLELEYPENYTDSWDKFFFTDYHRGGGKQNEAMDLSYLSFTNGNYIYQVYDEYAEDKRSIGVRITDLTSHKTFEIEGNPKDVTGGLMFLSDKLPKIKRPVDEIEQIKGRWQSTDSGKSHGTDLTVAITGINRFSIDINAFYINNMGYAHIGQISGKGLLINNKLEFSVEDGKLKGVITYLDDILSIKYLGDTSQYAGVNVVFADKFIRDN